MKVRALIGRIAAGVLVLALAGGGAYLFMTQPAKAPAAPAAPPPPQVGVVELKAADVPLPLEFSGRVAGFRVVEIRAQVSGMLLKREYLEGAVVDVGDVLFRIDPRTYEAALARANAQVAQAKATLTQAEENYSRAESAWPPQKVAHAEGARGCHRRPRPGARRVQSTEADVQTAKLNLEFTIVKAPDDGPHQPDVAARGHADPGAADAADDDHAARSGLRQLHHHRLASCAPCRRSTDVGRGPVRSRRRQGRAAVRRWRPPIPSPARSTRARAPSIPGPAPSRSAPSSPTRTAACCRASSCA